MKTRNASGNAFKSSLTEYLSNIVVAFDDDGEEGGEGGDGSSGDDDQGSEGGEGEGGASGSDSDEVKDPEKKKLSDEAAANRVRAKKAEDELAQARAKLKEIEDADKSELEKVQRDFAELQERTANDAKIIRDQAVRLAFFESGAAALFKEPSKAKRLLDLDDLEVNDEGDVDAKALKAKAEALLKESPYLAASDDSSGSGGTGGSPNNGKRKKDEASKEALAKKYPALAGRS